MAKAHPMEVRAECLARYFMGSTPEEISQDYAIPVSTVKSWISRLKSNPALHTVLHLNQEQVKAQYQAGVARLALAFIKAQETLLRRILDADKLDHATLIETTRALADVSAEHYGLVEAIKGTTLAEDDGVDP